MQQRLVDHKSQHSHIDIKPKQVEWLVVLPTGVGEAANSFAALIVFMLCRLMFSTDQKRKLLTGR